MRGLALPGGPEACSLGLWGQIPSGFLKPSLEAGGVGDRQSRGA